MATGTVKNAYTAVCQIEVRKIGSRKDLTKLSSPTNRKRASTL